MGKFQRELDKIANENRHAFLRTFFDKEGYAEVEVNGWWLVQQGGENRLVSIYSADAFKKYKDYKTNA